MPKCNHEKVCVECVKEEIRATKAKLKELEDKLPKSDTTITHEFHHYPNIITFPIQPQPYYPYNIQQPYTFSGGKYYTAAGTNSVTTLSI